MDIAVRNERLMFSRTDITRMIVPLFIEQVLTSSVTVIGSIMVASAGEAAVSGVSLVNQVFMVLRAGSFFFRPRCRIF